MGKLLFGVAIAVFGFLAISAVFSPVIATLAPLLAF